MPQPIADQHERTSSDKRKRSTPNQRVPSSSLGRCTPSDLGVLVIKRAAAVSWGPESGRTAASVVDDQQVAARSQRRIPSTPLLLADPIIAASHAVMFSLIVNPSPSKTSAAFGWSPGPPRVHRVVSQLLSTGHGPRWNATNPIPILPFRHASAEILRPSPPQRPRT